MLRMRGPASLIVGSASFTGSIFAQPHNVEPQFTRLRSRQEVAEATMAFHFEKPQGFTFKAGQTIDLTLMNPSETDAEGDTRTFSIASAPDEAEIMIATRVRPSAFKRVLSAAAPGTSVKMSEPMGSFTLHKNVTKPGVFLAGGIGITPFRSMSFDAVKRNTGHRLLLFYSSHRPEDAAFLDELCQLGRSQASFRFVPTMTAMEGSAREWRGETGYIRPDMLSHYLEDLRGPIYYIAGPPGMVNDFHERLIAAGVDEDDIRAEEFAGY
jgi:ferredoxin-NADP reductase